VLRQEDAGNAATEAGSRESEGAEDQQVAAAGAEANGPAGEQPMSAYATIIAETATCISRLSVSEAVMQMDLSDQQVMMFHNSTTGELNVVYRRTDGHIGWIDPSTAETRG
jgi:hypothetical protein